MNLSEGTYRGSNRLYLPDMPDGELVINEFQSEGEITIGPHVGDTITRVAYTWSHKGGPCQGALVAAYDLGSGVATAGWADSWHQSAATLFLTGTVTAEGFAVTGSYPAGDGSPDWGWRIEITTDGAAATMKMFNIMPDGTEMIAVHGDYHRTV